MKVRYFALTALTDEGKLQKFLVRMAVLGAMFEKGVPRMRSRLTTKIAT
jgi:hypothetical protein